MLHYLTDIQLICVYAEDDMNTIATVRLQNCVIKLSANSFFTIHV